MEMPIWAMKISPCRQLSTGWFCNRDANLYCRHSTYCSPWLETRTSFVTAIIMMLFTSQIQQKEPRKLTWHLALTLKMKSNWFLHDATLRRYLTLDCVLPPKDSAYYTDANYNAKDAPALGDTKLYCNLRSTFLKGDQVASSNIDTMWGKRGWYTWRSEP